MQVGSSLLTKPAASRLPILSKCISVQGPQGPVSPISQKLSYLKIHTKLDTPIQSGNNLKYNVIEILDDSFNKKAYEPLKSL